MSAVGAAEVDPTGTASTRGSLKRELAVSSLGTLGLRAASLGLGFLSTLILAKHLGAGGLGIYAWAYALAATLQVAGALGFDRLAPREIAGALATERWADAASFLRAAPRVVAGASVAVALTAAAVCAWSVPSERLTPALIALGVLPVLALTSLRQGVLQGLGRVARGRIPDDLLRPLVFTSVLVVGWTFTGMPESSAAAMIVQAVAIVCAFQAGAWLLHRALPTAVRGARGALRVRWHVREAVPLMLVSGAAITLTQIDLILVGALCEPAEAGIYALATRMAQLVGLAEYAVNAAYIPVVARLYAQGSIDRLQRGSARVAGAGFLLAAALAVPVAVFAGPLVAYFGSSFHDAATPLRLVALSFLVSAAAGQNGSILAMTGRTSAVLRGSVVALVSNVGLNAVLIPLWQADGAAIAWLVSVIVWNAWLAIEVHRGLGINASLFGLLGRPAHGAAPEAEAS